VEPGDRTFKEIPVPYDMFCAGHATLPDGRVLISGGTDAYAGHRGAIGFVGARTSYVFDPANDSYSKVNDTIDGHWYPTLTKLENGDIWSVGGYHNRDGGAGRHGRGDVLLERDALEGRAETTQTGRYWGTTRTSS
jgi:hypothetical protein